MDILFSHGRTAFKYGLKYLGLKRNDRIMLPAYICDAVVEPLKELGIKVIYYKINENFTINYNNLIKNYNNLVKALVIINYFGFEECKKKYYSFCKKNNLFLIEDNCHYLSDTQIKKNNYSHFVFYSNKKLIKEIFSGGLLRINEKRFKNFDIFKLDENLKKFKVNFKIYLNTFLEKNFLIFKRYLKYKLLKIPNYNNINAIKNKKLIKDYKIDDYSKYILNKINLDKIKNVRQKNYATWEKICKKNKSIRLINRPKSRINIPWVFPAFVDDPKLRKKLFDYGWKNGYSITSWPSLPKNNINHNNKKIWKKLICFDTDRAPPLLNLDIE